MSRNTTQPLTKKQKQLIWLSRWPFNTRWAMLKQYPIAKARDQFTSLVRDVEQDATVELTRRGKPVAIIMSIKEYQRLQASRIGFWDAYTTFRDKVNLQQLDIQPELFKEWRDLSPGREVNL